MRLLILDDDPRICAALSAMAARAGWQADTATDRAGFERHLATAIPDVVALDLRLGPTDGIEMLRHLDQIGYRGFVILMSGFDDRVLEAARGIGAGFGLNIVHALEKPVRAETFTGILRELAARDIQGANTAPGNPAGVQAMGPSAITPGEIMRACEAGEMSLHFQPIVAARSGELTSMEALLRWRSPARGPVSPDIFIPIAETDLSAMEKLTCWVIDRALSQRRGFVRAGIDVPVAINVSGVCLRDLAFPDIVAGLVAQAGFAPSAINFEVTESIAIVGARQTADILTRLRLRGFEVAIDDLGAGYASLQALLDIPFSYLKIDKSFVAAIGTARNSISIVRAIADVARGMSLRSVAEGVETADIAQRLMEIGIDALQGSWLSMPLPADELVAWARQRKSLQSAAS